MSPVDLRFVQSPGSCHLLFGGDQTGPSPPVDARLLATLPALTFSADEAQTLVSMLAPMIRDFLANG